MLPFLRAFTLSVLTLLLLLPASIELAHAQTGDARILAAREALRKGDRNTLERLALAREPHVLDSYVSYWLWINRLARTEGYDEAELSAWLARDPESNVAERLRGNWLRRAASDQRWQQVRTVYREVRRPNQELTCFHWTARLRTGDNTALQEARALWLELTDSSPACHATLRELVDSGHAKLDDVWWRARHQIDSRSPESAHTTLNWLPVAERPAKAAIDRVIKEPAAYLARLPADWAATRKGRELALSAVARLARSDVRAAHTHYQRIAERFGPAEQAYAWTVLGHRSATAHLPEAVSWFARAGDSTMTPDQRAWRVRAALRARDWPQVAGWIDAMPQAERNEPDWIYWRARAHAARNEPERAQALYSRIAGEPHFYGMLAGEELGQPFRILQPKHQLSREDQARAHKDPGLNRALTLFRLDMRTEAVREWNWAVRDRDEGFLVAAARLALDHEIYDRAINTAELGNAHANFDLRYLMPFREVVEPQVRERGLDLGWVYGVMRQESRFITVARSSAGASGLMQVMPATAQYVAKRQGFRDYHPRWLNRLDTNVLLGTSYMQMILGELDHHPVLASAGYNAGPGRARRWRAAEPLEGAIYAETIPFDETRDYVKKVMANAVVYGALVEGQPQSLKSRLGTVGSR